jgi:hypothetical protein
MRLARVFVETDVHSGERHPLAVRRDDGLAYTLELHHVFKGEGALALCETAQRATDKKDNDTA